MIGVAAVPTSMIAAPVLMTWQPMRELFAASATVAVDGVALVVPAVSVSVCPAMEGFVYDGAEGAAPAPVQTVTDAAVPQYVVTAGGAAQAKPGANSSKSQSRYFIAIPLNGQRMKAWLKRRSG